MCTHVNMLNNCRDHLLQDLDAGELGGNVSWSEPQETQRMYEGVIAPERSLKPMRAKH